MKNKDTQNQGCLLGCLSILAKVTWKVTSLTLISSSLFFAMLMYFRMKDNPNKSISTHAREQVEQFFAHVQILDAVIGSLQKGGSITFGDSIEGVVNARGEPVNLEDLPPYLRKEVEERGTAPPLPKIEGEPAICQGSSSRAERWQNIKEKATLIHEDLISAVAISSDNRYLASGSYNHKVYIWDLNTNQLI